jgi:hypothetical protein
MHENTLRTILESLGITVFPGASNGAVAMSDFFTPTQGSGVTVTMPVAGAQVSSPFNFSATASSDNGKPITTMVVYIDNQQQSPTIVNHTQSTTFTGTGTFQASPGQHTISANAWDSTGKPYVSQGVKFTVTPNGPRMTINSPANGSTVNSPVSFSAHNDTEGLPITQMKVYLGNTLIGTYNGNGTSTLTVNDVYPMGPGAQQLTASAWDTSPTGGIHTDRVTFNVNAGAGVAITSPRQGALETAKDGVIFYGTATSNGLPMSSMIVYIDGKQAAPTFFNNTKSTSFTVTFTLPANLAGPGTHNITVNAWDTNPNGVPFQSQTNFTVQ